MEWGALDARLDSHLTRQSLVYNLKKKKFRDWSLMTGRGGGGLQNGRGGGACEVLPLQKGGTEKVLAILKGARKVLG